jgi:putative chitinase
MSFSFNFTTDKLAACINNQNIGVWYDALYQLLPDYGITTKRRVAGWLSQTGQESGDFRFLTENLNYSADALMRVWPRHYPTQAIANRYHRQPEKIANRSYANRMGNGPEESGDGWKYRGRGLIQVTGKDNYLRCSMTLYGDDILLDKPEILCEVDGAVRSACWYWNFRNINVDADNGDVLSMTKKINGGTHGLDERTKRYNRCMSVL